MTFHSFTDEIIKIISGKFSEDTKIHTEEIVKNNGFNQTALIISEPGSNIFPTIYIDDFFDRAVAGEPTENICNEILCIYNKHKIDGEIDVSCLNDFDSVKKRIVFRLINTEKNKKLLQDIPHRDYLDLSIIYSIYFDTPSDVCAGSIIHNSHCNLWKINEKTLYSHAIKNSETLLPHSITSLPDFLNAMSDFEILEPESSEKSMYILTNSIKTHGASCLLYKEVLHRFASKMHRDVFILPSSIHEIMLIADTGEMIFEELTELVREVNRTQVSKTDYLSDHAYLYRKDTDTIEF